MPILTSPYASDLPASTAREEIAKREIGVTTVTPAVTWFLLSGFLVAIGMVPLLEWARTRAAGREASAWSELGALRDRVPAALAQDRGWWGRLVAANREVLASRTAFENGLEDESHLGRLLRPPAQWVLTRWLGVGNEQVYVGRDKWLFYRPDVEYVTSAGFLEPSQLARRRIDASEWERPPAADPRPAIVRFNRDLRARGITLVVMPTPVKPTIHPEKLAGPDADRDGPLQNPSYATFIRDLADAGVLVFDPSPALVDARRLSPHDLYLSADTHWRPEGMELAARLLSEFLVEHALLPAVPPHGYRAARRAVQGRGDTALMLDLPPGQLLYPPESIWLRRVVEPDGRPWRSSPSADVLLLGDSFTNIYSLASMRWGSSSGFAEQLSFELQRPIARIVQNDEGAAATRAIVQRRLGGGADPLAGKRVVIHQFAARELAFGDWRLTPLDGAAHDTVSDP